MNMWLSYCSLSKLPKNTTYYGCVIRYTRVTMVLIFDIYTYTYLQYNIHIIISCFDFARTYASQATMEFFLLFTHQLLRYWDNAKGYSIVGMESQLGEDLIHFPFCSDSLMKPRRWQRSFWIKLVLLLLLIRADGMKWTKLKSMHLCKTYWINWIQGLEMLPLSSLRKYEIFFYHV